MNDPYKTKPELIKEISALKKRIQELERSETERKRAEEELRFSRQKLQLLIDAGPDFFFLKDLDLRYQLVNSANARFFGRDEADILGRTDAELMPEESAVACQESDRLAIREKRTVVTIEPVGDRFYETYKFPVMVADQIVGVAGIIRDITDRKRAEEDLKTSEKKYRSVIENIQDVFYRSDARGLLLMGSPSGAKMFGYDSVDEMIGLPLDIFWPDPIGRQQLLDQIKAKGSARDFEAVLLKKDGTTFNASFTTQFYYDDQGNFLGTEGIIREITHRKLLESQLLQARKLEAVGTLAGGVAHDFNNILMGIQGYASLMMLDLDTHHPHYERLKQIEEQVQSATDLTKQLLGFARGGRYEMRTADMNEIIRKTSSIFGRTKKELTVHGRYGKDLWTVEVDRGQIEQVLLNLYVNAWHAMPSGGELYLETSNVVLDESYAALHVVLPGNYVRVSVADTGMGMEEETRKRIFDPFFTTREMGRGTGLGLAMVYGIMKGHKGFIDVNSKPGHGTTFTLYLPASEKKALEERSVTTEALRGSETILLVDDEPTVLAVSKAILESLGYTVHGKGSGQEAIAFLREMKNSIDLVILDMIMPVLSGSETFDRIRELNPSLKVILSSGYSLNGQAQQIMDRGCRGFIQKPFSIARLSRKIREVLEK
ncbi:MAG: PAS domain S-box protein [Deltaproteobacteria bacterium]|nr:PAS domain S-box protein [Deltaproteobacteria bacterium]